MAERAPGPGVAERRADLRADCDRCFGLCCVAPAFARSADFAIDKAHGEPCPNLGVDFRCSIHSRLRDSGFRGCTVYHCVGAGPATAMGTFDGVSWRDEPGTAETMFAVFEVQRVLHELLWYLAEIIGHPACEAIRAQLVAADDETRALTELPRKAMLELDAEAHRIEVANLLRMASELIRGNARGDGRHSGPRNASGRRIGPDLIGADLRGADLRGQELRGCLLIAADLTGADLRHADLIGADLRDADLSGADLSSALYLTPMQVGAARGNATTQLPDGLDRPAHWK